MLNSKEIRKKFIDYFAQREHKAVGSDSLIPSGDPTLLFTSAGMVQFKKNFLGQSKDTFKRATSCQKCFRTSDIEQVGYTSRHLTFFEMLGNFSFGDYFKEDAINWGWEFLTKEMGLPADKLYATIYKDDNDAFELWKKIVPESMIIRLGEDSNFWNMGPTGPCGPCSEILIDLGPELGCDKPDCGPGCDCDRYLEVWNLVFTQFDRQEDGSLKDLPKKNIDTGMGLERLVAAATGKKSIFDTDLFEPIIKQLAEILDINPKDHVSQLRMMSDHCRGITFLISDGILPSNEGRGYVLRRLLRRALRAGKMLGMDEPFLYKVTAQAAETMKDAYPELEQRRENIASITKMEEENFLGTLETGIHLLNELISRHKDDKSIPGTEVFKLYDTYGFPFELTKEIAREKGLSIDEQEFLDAQKAAQEKSRAAWTGSGEKDITFYSMLHMETGDNEFKGYDTLCLKSKAAVVIRGGKKRKKLNEGDEGEIILPQTPFYAESGGQVGDTGKIKYQDSMVSEVTGTIKPVDGLIVHRIKVIKGEINVGQDVEAVVDENRRKQIMRHHTATHLLHKALRQILGTHVTQAGSLVTPDYFRFDFTHFHALKSQEIDAVEEIVNKSIRDNMKVSTTEKDVEEAKKSGAMALFGEKYGDSVRVVEIGDKESFSTELCGGTHADKTGDIGLFKITSESSIASGTRRIEAVVGKAAEDYVRNIERSINDIAHKLKGSKSDVVARVEHLLSQEKALEKEIRKLKSKLATGSGTADNVCEVKGVKVLSSKISDVDPKALREISDNMKNKLGSGIVVLYNIEKDKFAFVVNVSQDVTKSGYSAGKIAKNLINITGGSGGGRPEFAQGGGKDSAKVDEALSKIAEMIL